MKFKIIKGQEDELIPIIAIAIAPSDRTLKVCEVLSTAGISTVCLSQSQSVNVGKIKKIISEEIFLSQQPRKIVLIELINTTKAGQQIKVYPGSKEIIDPNFRRQLLYYRDVPNRSAVSIQGYPFKESLICFERQLSNNGATFLQAGFSADESDVMSTAKRLNELLQVLAGICSLRNA